MSQVHPAIPVVARLIESAAARLGYEFRVLDPEFGYLCEVRDGGRAIVLIGGVSPVNRAAVVRLCKDKHYTNLVVERAGFRVPRTVRVLSPSFFTQPDYASVVGIEPATQFAEDYGFPLVVKPNGGAKGIGVSLVDDDAGLALAIESQWEAGHRVVLLQERVPGRDFRLNFVGDEFIGGYERTQVVLEGDGRRTLRELLVAADPRWTDNEFATRFSEAAALPQLDAVLPLGEQRALGSDTILNLNQLATASAIEALPESCLQYCLAAGRAVGARHFGIDLKAKGLDADPASIVVIEVNGSPLLTGLYELGHEELAIRGQSKALQLAFENF